MAQIANCIGDKKGPRCMHAYYCRAVCRVQLECMHEGERGLGRRVPMRGSNACVPHAGACCPCKTVAQQHTWPAACALVPLEDARADAAACAVLWAGGGAWQLWQLAPMTSAQPHARATQGPLWRSGGHYG